MSAAADDPQDDRRMAPVPPARTAATPTGVPAPTQEPAPTPSQFADGSLAASTATPSSRQAESLDHPQPAQLDSPDRGGELPSDSIPAMSAEALVKQAHQQPEAAHRYVLLDQARTLASDAGDLRLCLSIINEMGQAFEIDAGAMTVEVLKKLAPSVTRQDEHRLVAQTALTCGQRAAEAGDAEQAESLYVLALNATRQLGDAQLEGTIQRRLEQLTPAGADPGLPPAVANLTNAITSQQVVEANEALQRNPKDAAAHLTLGMFLCMVKEDWNAGLTHLAFGTDATLSKLARDDMLLPRTTKNLVDLGDQWYQWGLGKDPSTRRAAWARAVEKYKAASPRLTGSRKQQVDQRLAELATAINEQERVRTIGQSWLAAPPGLIRSFEGHQDHVTALAVSVDGSVLVSAAEDRTVRLWNVGSGQEIWKQRTPTSHLNGIVITWDGQFVISNYDDKQFAVMSAANGHLTRRVGESPMSPTALRLTPDGLSLVWAVRSRPPNMFVWGLAKDQAAGAYGEGDCPNVLALSRDGQRLATGDSRGVVRVFDASTGKVLHQLRAHQDAVTDLDFSPGGQHVATAALNELCVFDLATYEPVRTLRVESVRTAAFSPDGRRLASGGFREEVYLWDLETGRRLDTLKAEAAFSDRHITRLAFLPDPQGLITGATGGKIRLWRLPD
jgi:WD40 repeat protein